MSVDEKLVNITDDIKTSDRRKQGDEADNVLFKKMQTRIKTESTNDARTSLEQKPVVLLTEDTKMPETNVGDLKDVMDAINRMCENMTSSYDTKSDSFDSIETGSLGLETGVNDDSESTQENFNESAVNEYDYFDAIRNKYVENVWIDSKESVQEIDAQNVESKYFEETQINIANVDQNYGLDIIEDKLKDTDVKVEVNLDVSKRVVTTERWSEGSQISLQGHIEEPDMIASDTETLLAHCETGSEMYYTASSEVSLTSDTAERIEDSTLNPELTLISSNAQENLLTDSMMGSEIRSERDGVMSGHVAAMRERFENMTRASTPCSDLFRSISPSLDRASPVPDLKG